MNVRRHETAKPCRRTYEETKMEKLLIAIPCTDFMHADFVKCLLKLTAKLNRDGINHEVCILNGTLVYMARNKLARKAVNEKFTDVLWLDCDMIFNEDIVDDLMFAQKDLISGIYVTRRPAYHSVIFTKLDPIERMENFGTEPVQVAGFGFGAVLCKTQVLEDVMSKYDQCFTPTEQFGEDLAFCWRAATVNHPCWCDPSVRVGHIAHIPVWPDQAPAFGVMKGE